MQKTVFEIPKMDCPSEEKLVRLSLQGLSSINLLKFDLGKRRMTAIHEGNPTDILEKLIPLNFGAKLSTSEQLSEVEVNLVLAEKAMAKGNMAAEAKVLKLLLAINAAMFLFEIFFGFLAQSTGLIADAMVWPRKNGHSITRLLIV